MICLGGKEFAADRDEHLLREREFLRCAAVTDVPTLGICLGSQLLAVALGGQAIRGGTHAEVGFIDVVGTDDAAGDWTGTRFSFHSDTFTLPPDATPLARSREYPQAFAFRRTIGVQYHPESSVAGIRQLMEGEPDKVRAAGADPEQISRDALGYESEGGRHLAVLIDQLLVADPAATMTRLCKSGGNDHER